MFRHNLITRSSVNNTIIVHQSVDKTSYVHAIYLTNVHGKEITRLYLPNVDGNNEINQIIIDTHNHEGSHVKDMTVIICKAIQ